MDFCGRCGSRLAGWHDAEGVERRRCAACGWVWFGYPTPVVLVLGVAADGRILYTRKDAWPPGMWGLVAGLVERGEPAETAAVREVAEETGLLAADPEFAGTIPFREQLLICFRVRLGPGEPRRGSDADAVDLAPPQPDRMPPWAPARWLLEQYLSRPTSGPPR